MNVGKFFNNIFVKNIILAILISIVLVLITLWGLDAYTQHGKAVEVPEVKGLQVEKAIPFFTNRNLNYQVIDSTFVKNAAPGTILETDPPVGTKVKEGRTIYITINSYTAQMLGIPEVKDMSQRQAMAILKSMGFEQIEVKTIPGAYRDLVIGLESRGRELRAGDRVPVDTPLTLKVSSGSGEELFPGDTMILEESPEEESWF